MMNLCPHQEVFPEIWISRLFPDEFILVPASYCDGISILTDSDGFYIATERTQ